MPRRSKGPHLWFRRARPPSHPAAYVVIDGSRQVSTRTTEISEAERFLADYIATKHVAQVSTTCRDIRHIPIADVITVYARDVAPTVSRPHAAYLRLNRLLEFFGDRTLADVNGGLCRAYAKASSTDANARRDLQDFRAAINHHQREGLHNQIVGVVIPPARPARERWLERTEAARLLWTLWRRPRCSQIAKFMLVALYTGRRASVVCGASFIREPGRSWIDLSKGYLWPPERVIQTKKRNPPIPLPTKLLTHLRAWSRRSRYVVPWGSGPHARGKEHPVKRVDRTMAKVAVEIGLGKITPHVLRHTAATWQMRAGTDMLEAGRYLGMTTRTLETVYAHHRPEHLTSARDAYQRLK